MGRYLGQHFLINKRQLRKFVGALEIKPGDTIIEIGPGHGELTLLLARNFQFPISNFQIIAIEKDKKLVQVLQKKFASDKNIKIIEGDALKILPELCFKFQVSGFKITGNIPYYITGRLLRILAELKPKPKLIVLIIQKEVARRIIAKPPRMNLLAASVQFWAEPEIIDYIPKRDVRPQPKVDSAIITLMPTSAGKQIDADRYYRLIRLLFKQPRKTIINNLVAGIKYPAFANALAGRQVLRAKDKEEIIKKLIKFGINPSDRPQNLSIKQIQQLSTLF